MTRKYYFSTKDLVTVALLSALGGILSTYVGYLGNMVNHIFGVPFGAGQFMAGLHVLWMMLALGITKKKGVGTLTGVLKGVIELFMGSMHGVVIVVVSAVQGLLADLFLFSDKAKAERGIVSFTMAAGVSAASNVIVLQLFFFSGVPLILILMLCMLAGASGVIFGGGLAIEMIESLEQAGVTSSRKRRLVDVPEPEGDTWDDRRIGRKKRLTALAVTTAFLAAFSIGAVYYFTFVFTISGGTVAIEGMVESPYDFAYADFEGQEITVNAELKGSVTYVASRDYTGIPVSVILDNSTPLPEATALKVYGSDGYYATFDLSDVLADETLILMIEDGNYRLVAPAYEGSYWVEDVVRIQVS
ncbi:MAG: ECF transporter S component [Candidatus Thermoplasmatota archaeon]|nr:ECF transporter S component [Candidatus Thermoplasmatota archaeon]